VKTSTTILLVGGAALAYWLTRPKPVVTVTEVLPPPNSGPVVNGLGNITRRSIPQVQRRSVPQVTPYKPPVRPRFSTPLFFR